VSTSLYEGFPYLYLQSISVGVPVVTTDVGGAHEVTSGGKIGLIYCDNDLNPVISYLLKYLQDPIFRDSQIRGALEISSLHTLEKSFGDTKEAYHKAWEIFNQR
jgi:glycosyltransferase involved in cell wall biosynthesis